MLPVVIRTLILIGSLTTTGLNYSRLDLNSNWTRDRICWTWTGLLLPIIVCPMQYVAWDRI